MTVYLGPETACEQEGKSGGTAGPWVETRRWMLWIRENSLAERCIIVQIVHIELFGKGNLIDNVF